MSDNNTLSIEIGVQSPIGEETKEISFNTRRDLNEIPEHEICLIKRYVELLFAHFCMSTTVQDIDQATDHAEDLGDVINVASAASDAIESLSECRIRLEENLLACFYVSGCDGDAPLRRDIEMARESSEIEFMSILNDIREGRE